MLEFAPRVVPAELVERYHAEGHWTDDTFGAVLDDALRRSAEHDFRIWSKERPYAGHIGEVAELARRFASGLQARGIAAGDVVALQLPNWMEAAAVFYGAALLGCVLVPVVHIYGPKEMGYILSRSHARVLVTADRFGANDYLAALPAHRATCPDLELVVVVGDSGGNEIAFAELLHEPPLVSPSVVEPDEPVVVAFTSGTTADPKGVVHTHRTLLAELRQLVLLRPRGRPVLMGSPISHATGMLGGLLMPLLYDDPIHLIDRWDASYALRILVDANLSAGGGATFFLTSLLDSPDFRGEHLERMRFVNLGGAPVPAAVAERADALGISLIRAYGSTEHPSTTGGSHDDPRDKRLYTDGRPLPGVEIRLDEETSEVMSRGPELFAGYLDPALTAAAIDPAGWYATGDVGVIDMDGYLTITDRVKDIIIRGGENISAAEVESLLATLPGVAEVAVVAAPDAKYGEHGCAFFRLLPARTGVTLDEVQAHLAAAGVAKQKWPEELRVVGDFERTPSGKVKKHVLRALVRAEVSA